jgi:hypothetical protein
MAGARNPMTKRAKATIFCLSLTLYLFSTGPVAWATNNDLLPDEVEWIYLPLAPLMQIQCVNDLFVYYTANIWHGFPYGYTTL